MNWRHIKVIHRTLPTAVLVIPHVRISLSPPSPSLFFYLNMTGIYLFVIMIAATAIFAYPGDNPILPVPTKCPSVDPLNYTVHLAHKTDCTKFYKCFNGKKYKMSCPDNWRGGKLHFNKVLQVCDYPERAGCNDNSTCPAGSDGKAFPHECSCSKYYVCHNGDLVLKKCPKGKHWSTKKQQCLRAAIAGCIQPNKTI